jgi:hypothetical protein
MEEEDPTPGNINPYTTIGAIVWYVFLSLCCGLPMLCTCVGCSYIKIRKRHDGHLQIMTQEALDMEISRMEANIQIFSEQQKVRRKRELLKAFEKHTVVITPRHLETNDRQLPYKLSEGCTICLGTYEVGDMVVHSSNASCQHLFHESCIVSWLMTRQSPLCPCCRQTFVHDLYECSPLTTSLSDDD